MINSAGFKVVRVIVGVGSVVFPLANGVIKSKVLETHGKQIASFVVTNVLKKTV